MNVGDAGQKRKERKLALGQKTDEEEHLMTYGELRDGIGTQTYSHGPIDYAEMLKLRFRVGDLDVPEIRKRHTGSRVEDKVEVQISPHGVGYDELCKQERDVLQ